MDTLYAKSRKVVVVGAGDVGSTFAYALAQSGLAEEIGLVDQNEELAQGQALDLAHGMPFFPRVRIYAGGAADYADARVIVITAGSKQRPGENRLALLQRNASIIRSIMDDILAQNSRAIILIVSNPVDVLTYVAQQYSGWPRGRIIGSGTVLDSARFRYLLSEHCNLSAHNVHAYILGEHGDSEFAAWSMVHFAGITVDQYCALCGKCGGWAQTRQTLEEQVRNSAYHIINYKGATYYAVGLAIVRIVRAILRNEHRVLTISTLLQGEYGLDDVCLSVPTVLAREGVERVIVTDLPPEEHAALVHSASVLKSALAELRAGDSPA